MTGVTMTCGQVQALLDDYDDDTLNEQERSAIQAHTASCQSCGKLLADARRFRTVLSNQAATVPDPGEPYFEQMTRLVLAKTSDRPTLNWISPIAGKSVAHRQQQWRRLGMAMATCAASVLLFAASVWLGLSYQQTRLEVIRSTPAENDIRPSFSFLLNNESEPSYVSRHETAMLGQGLVMMGAPGVLQRAEALPFLHAGR